LILDWINHCKTIEENNKLARDDPSDNKTIFKQEIVYIAYLINQGYTLEVIKNKWSQITNGSAHSNGDTSQFIHLFEKAKAKKYKQLISRPSLKPINIYKEEIDEINNLPIEYWEKQFFMGLLCYYKFAHQYHRTVEFSTTMINWLFRQIDFGNYKFRSYRDIRESVNRHNREYNPHLIKYYSVKNTGQYSTFTLSYYQKSGKTVAVISDLSQISKIFELLHKNTRICIKCGAEFSVTSKTKRDLCNSCYSLIRRLYKKEKSKEYYTSKK